MASRWTSTWTEVGTRFGMGGWGSVAGDLEAPLPNDEYCSALEYVDHEILTMYSCIWSYFSLKSIEFVNL